MALLGMFFLVLIVLSFISVIVLFYNDGRLVKHKGAIATVTIYALFLAYISASSLPSNYTLNIALCIAIGGVGAIGGLIALVKSDKFFLARVLIAISIIGNLITIFF